MSVKRLIQEEEIKHLLDRVIPIYSRSQRVPLRVPCSSSALATLVGTAFDYAFRFELQRRCPHAHDRVWVAESALKRFERDNAAYKTLLRDLDGGAVSTGGGEVFSSLADLRPRLKSAKRMRRRISNARIFLRKHLKRRAPDHAWKLRLAEHALRLGRLDPIYRGGYYGDGLFAPNPTAVVEEVVALLDLVLFENFMDSTAVFLNPIFGRYSSLIGGADADLIAGDRLIDVKVLVKSDIERGIVRQLVAYLILARAARRDGAPLPEVRSLQVYFARHAHLFVFPVDPIINHPAYPEVEASFLSCAKRLVESWTKERRAGSLMVWARPSSRQRSE